MIKRLILSGLVAATVGMTAVSSQSQEFQLFRIGAGDVGDTYYPIGAVIARAISQPPGSTPCEDPANCGVPNLVSVVEASAGSVANIQAIGDGALESGLAQADLAYWGNTGINAFQEHGPVHNLRAIASLYTETVHIVARKDAGITSVRDLKGKRVSLDEPGSGTLADARIILEAYGLTDSEVQASYIKPRLAAERLRQGKLDAFFAVTGHPSRVIVELAATTEIILVPISPTGARSLLEESQFFSTVVIPAETYVGVEEVATLGVRALLVVGAQVDLDMVYNVTKALWSDRTLDLLRRSHPQGNQIRLETALDGMPISIHPGARRFYKEVAVLQ